MKDSGQSSEEKSGRENSDILVMYLFWNASRNTGSKDCSTEFQVEMRSKALETARRAILIIKQQRTLEFCLYLRTLQKAAFKRNELGHLPEEI